MISGKPKPARMRVLGAMSGTSLDGVDAAVLDTDGHAILGFGPTAYRAYSDEERATISAGLGKWSGAEVEAARRIVEAAHLEVLSEFSDIDLIGFHGQTLAHAPRAQGTLQVGNGAALAKALVVPVVWDFRTEDVTRGGEGAPLAPFYHFACARHMGARAPVCFLNLGGVGNLTYVDPAREMSEIPGALLAFDTGPANAPINDLMMARRGLPYDAGGALAASGQVHGELVATFLEHPYFAKTPPKSLDRDDFAGLPGLIADLGDADAAATLCAISAACVARAMMHCPTPPSQVLVTGGGRNNPVLMTELRKSLHAEVRLIEAVGLNGDMLEAQAFAYLAARVRLGLPTSAPGTTGVNAPVSGGCVSWPSRSE